MNITCIGHHSWIVCNRNLNVYIDPVLKFSFGSTKGLRFPIKPYRDVDHNNLPKADIVIFTSEHIQHFQPSSLKHLNSDAKIYVSKNFSKPACDIIKSLGFDYDRIPVEYPFKYMDMQFCFLGSGTSTFIWDSTVTGLLVTDSYSNDCLYFQSDTQIKEQLTQLLSELNFPAISTCFLTNNNHAYKEGHIGAFGNLLPLKQTQSFHGVRLLNQAVREPLLDFEGFPNVIISGGGFESPMSMRSTPLWDQKFLVECISKLSIKQNAFYLEPGNIYDSNKGCILNERSNWISLSKDFNPKKYNHSQSVESVSEKQIEKLEAFIDQMVKVLLLSELGNSMLGVHEYLGKRTNSKRFIFDFHERQYEIDLTTASISRLSEINSSPERDYPFGIKCTLKDFFNVISGEIQFWELAYSSLQQWYLGGPEQSPVAFFYSYFTPRIQPGLFAQCYERELRNNCTKLAV